MDRAANCQSIGIGVDGECVEMAQINLDPILNRTKSRRVAVSTTCTEEGYVFMVGICIPIGSYRSNNLPGKTDCNMSG